MIEVNSNGVLPTGWKWVRLGDAAKFIDYRGKTPKKTNSGVPLITAKNVKMGFINDEPREFIAEKDYKSWMTRGFPKIDDVLFTTEAPLGNVAQLKKSDRIALAQRLITFQSREFLTSSFLKYNLLSPQFQKLLNSKGTGTTVKGIKATVLKQLEIPIPPLPVQHAIVSKIEELFSELDKGIEQLKTAQQQLKTYRQAVLKWAFEGRLTNKDVKEGELPDGWNWVKLDDVAKKITDGEHFRPQTQASGIPFLSAKDIRDEGVSFADPLFISQETANKALQRCSPERGDILIVSRGATVGRMCIVNTDKQFCLLGSVILIKVNQTIDSKYLNYVLKSPFANQKMIAVSGATAQQAIYLRDIKNIEIPICPIDEQQQIVQEIESRLSVRDKVEETITTSLAQAETLRQSILKKAFEGRLIS